VSGSRHPRKKGRLWGNHKRNIKTWKGDSMWKPGERAQVEDRPRTERRSPRIRQKK